MQLYSLFPCTLTILPPKSFHLNCFYWYYLISDRRQDKTRCLKTREMKLLGSTYLPFQVCCVPISIQYSKLNRDVGSLPFSFRLTVLSHPNQPNPYRPIYSQNTKNTTSKIPIPSSNPRRTRSGIYNPPSIHSTTSSIYPSFGSMYVEIPCFSGGLGG